MKAEAESLGKAEAQSLAAETSVSEEVAEAALNRAAAEEVAGKFKCDNGQVVIGSP